MPEQKDTKTRIIDAAEALFAEAGFDAVPVREIMRRAESRLGLMSYYFESKDALLEAVVSRRSQVVNDRRRAIFHEIAADGRGSIDNLVEVLIHPFAELIREEDGEGWRAYAKLLAQLAQSPKWRHLIEKYFDEFVIMLIDELQKTYPQVPRARILRGLVMALGTMLSVLANTGRMHSLSEGDVRDDDLDIILPELCAFMAGGLKNLFAVA